MTSAADQELLRAFRRAVVAKIERDLAAEHRDDEERRARILPLVRSAIADARREGLCGDAWLFGSYAWGDTRPESDVDVLADRCADPIMLAVHIGRVTGTEVHVIALDKAPAELRERILRDGVPL